MVAVPPFCRGALLRVLLRLFGDLLWLARRCTALEEEEEECLDKIDMNWITGTNFDMNKVCYCMDMIVLKELSHTNQ